MSVNKALGKSWTPRMKLWQWSGQQERMVPTFLLQLVKTLPHPVRQEEDPNSKREGRWWFKETTRVTYIHSKDLIVLKLLSLPSQYQLTPPTKLTHPFKNSRWKFSRSEYFMEVLLSAELLTRSMQHLISSSLSLSRVCSAHNCCCVDKKIENWRGWMESSNTWDSYVDGDSGGCEGKNIDGDSHRDQDNEGGNYDTDDEGDEFELQLFLF